MIKRREKIFISIIVVLAIITGVSVYRIYTKDKEIKQTMATTYNMNLNELVGYIQNIENFLAKSTISQDSKSRSRKFNRSMASG